MANFTDIDAGYIWDADTIKYTQDEDFFNNNPSHYTSGVGFPTSEITNIEDGLGGVVETALQFWANVTDIEFEIDNTSPDIGILSSDVGFGPTIDGYTWIYPPPSSPDYEITRATIFVEKDVIDSAYTEWLYLHEIGHALGLDHPLGGDGTSGSYDQSMTIMSYNVYESLRAQTPMYFDILAIQDKYGTNTSVTTSTTYDIDGSAQLFTIWDGGGSADLISASTTSSNNLIDLRSSSDLATVTSGELQYGSQVDGSYFWVAYGSNIENVTGGSGQDIIYGSDVFAGDTIGEAEYEAHNGNNQLIGNAGDDILYGMGGDDTLLGGNNDDYLSGGSGNDSLAAEGGDDVLIGGEGADTYHIYTTDVGTTTIDDDGINSVAATADVLKIDGTVIGSDTPSSESEYGTLASGYARLDDNEDGKWHLGDYVLRQVNGGADLELDLDANHDGIGDGTNTILLKNFADGDYGITLLPTGLNGWVNDDTLSPPISTADWYNRYLVGTNTGVDDHFHYIDAYESEGPELLPGEIIHDVDEIYDSAGVHFKRPESPSGTSGRDSYYDEGGAPRGSTSISLGAGDDFADAFYGVDYKQTVHGDDGNDDIATHGGMGDAFGDDGDDAFSILAGLSGQALTRVYGGNGRDVFFGYGAAVIDGGAGIDTWNPGNNLDLNIHSGSGTATINGISVTYTSIEQVSIITNLSGQYLELSDGNDTISALGGDSTIDGGAGINDITLDGGGNILVVDATGTTSVIGFDGGNGDSIQFGSLTGGADFSDLTVTDVGGNAHITLAGHSGALILEGVSAVSVDSGWFSFHLQGQTFRGTAGADSFTGLDGDDMFYGSPGADSMDGGLGNDTISYADSDAGVNVNLYSSPVTGGHATGDTIVSIENLIGSAFNDTIYTDYSGAAYKLGEGDDYIYSAGDEVTIQGGDGNDVMLAGGEDNSVIGGLGDDRVYGSYTGGSIDLGDGNDTVFNGNYYASTIDLGDGDDAVDQTSIVGFYDGTVVDAGSGDDLLEVYYLSESSIYGGDGNDTVTFGEAGSEFLVDGGDGDDLLNGGYDNAYNTLGSTRLVTGGEGNDTIYADGNNNNTTLAGENGDDSIFVGAYMQFITADGGAGEDTLSGTGFGLTFTGGDDGDVFIISDTGRDYTITDFNAADGDTLDLSAYDDVFNNFAALDIQDVAGVAVLTLPRSGGVDVTVTFTGYTAAQIDESWFAVSWADPTIYGTPSADTISGTSGADRIDGLGANDSLSGNDGNDTLIGGAGADTLVGGNGIDEADYSASGAGIIINLVTNSHSGGDAAGDSLSSMEVIRGTSFNDTIYGAGNSETLYGGDGSDLFYSEVGANTIDGGNGIDVINYQYSTAAVNVNLDGAACSGGYAAGDVLTNVEYVYGSSYNDTITGNADTNALWGFIGDDSLFGGDNDEILDGGAGADTIDGGNGLDMAAYNASTAAVNINLATGTNTGGYAQGDVISNIEIIYGSAYNDTITGNTSANNIQGNSGNDSILGGDGNDTLEGGAGADTLVGGNGVDTVTYANSSAGVTINLGTNSHSGGEAAGDSLSGIEVVIGSAYGDTFYGGSNSETLAGGAGSDYFYSQNGTNVMIGGAGNDIAVYQYSNAAVNVNLATSSGSGGHAAGDSYSGIEYVFGSSYNDTVTGDASNNAFWGLDGNDSLIGGDGNDTIEAGNSNDTSTGGNGNDLFVFASGFGVDTVTDFEGEGAAGGDLIYIRANTGYTNYAGISGIMSYNSGTSTATINFGGGNVLTIQSVSQALSSDDFVFGA